MTVQILGSGCAKCRKLEQNTREAIATLGLNAEVVKVTDTDEILDMGVLMTPALAVDGTVKSAGSVPNPTAIAELLRVAARADTK
jgi:small redox-active disulfide protein 2